MSERKGKPESKFAGIFQSASAAPPASEPVTERIEASPAPPPSASRIGRPPGKRSDPEWKQFSVLLRKRTQRDATTILREQDSDGSRDLSDLLEELLERWVKERRGT